jgi:hypothetical protein
MSSKGKSISLDSPFKGIVRPFKFGGVTRLIQSFGKFFKLDDKSSREEHKTIYRGLKITGMALSNQSDFMQFLVSGKSSYTTMGWASSSLADSNLQQSVFGRAPENDFGKSICYFNRRFDV